MKKEKKTKKGGVLILALIFIILPELFNLIEMLDDGPDAGFIVPVIALVIIIAVVILTKALTKKSKAERQQPAQTSQAVSLPMVKRDREEAIHCTCRHGREKYIYQAQQFYKTGIIDREEYRVLRERYEKLELPEGIVD